jgi:hypothetical protein
MAHPSSRREGGRYYLQFRLGKLGSALYGRKIMRASVLAPIGPKGTTHD